VTEDVREKLHLRNTKLRDNDWYWRKKRGKGKKNPLAGKASVTEAGQKLKHFKIPARQPEGKWEVQVPSRADCGSVPLFVCR